MDEALLTTGQAADILGVSRSTVVRLLEEGTLPGFRLPARAGSRLKGHWRVVRVDVVELRRKMRSSSQS